MTSHSVHCLAFFCESLQHISHTTRITCTVASSVTVKQLDTRLTEHSVTSSAGCVSVGKRLLLPVVIRRCFDVRCSHVWERSLLGKFLLVPCVEHWSSGTSRNTSVTFLCSERAQMPSSALLETIRYFYFWHLALSLRVVQFLPFTWLGMELQMRMNTCNAVSSS